MPSAVIIGGRGQCGLAIGRRLAEEGWLVTSTTSGNVPEPESSPGIHWTHCERDRQADLSRVVDDGTDLVVDVTAYTTTHGDQLIGLGDRIGAAVVVSTVSVYADCAGRSLEEAPKEDVAPDWPAPIPEDWRTVTPGQNSYSARKAALEQSLRAEAPWPLTIVRPGAIHGRHSRLFREWYFIKRVLDGRRQVILPYDGESIFHPTATANLAELIFLAANRPGHRTVNCGDLNPPSAAQICEIVDHLTNTSTERVLVPGPLPAPTVGNNPWAMHRPVVVDMTLAGADLDYREAVSYREALADALVWALDATTGRDWREVFPTLARYPTELFDYAAEDTYLATAGVRGPL
jgi:nucleoside-diphosphate-sugar epimerase